MTSAPEDSGWEFGKGVGADKGLRDQNLHPHLPDGSSTTAPPPGEFASRDPLIGAQIDQYKIIERLGEGGMGIVYRAEQREPMWMEVAFKVIKRGLDTGDVIARFDAERQALALMGHPGVCRAFNAGTMPDGRPYFVMEYVKGKRITEYCDENKLSINRRLELFSMVCDAVQHAHNKGLIHRDLSPGNVMVTEVDGKAQPKVIDFGVAKALNQPLTERTLLPEAGRMIGKLEYMSPEQAEGSLDIDTRADIYSLGVLLYELLAGAPPFEGKYLLSKGFDEMRRIIREVDPPSPSTFYSKVTEQSRTAAARRAETVDHLAKTLRHELERIPLYALNKERDGRYETAAQFKQDIENYLSDRPLIAAPDSWWYRVKKAIQRNKPAVAAAAAIALALILGMAGTTWQMFEARSAEGRAQKSAQAAREAGIVAEQKAEEALAAKKEAEVNQRKAEANLARANTSLDFAKEILWGIDPDMADGADPTILLQALYRAEELLETLEDPAARAAYLNLLGEMYRRFNDRERAQRLLDEGLGLSRQLYDASRKEETLSANDYEVVIGLIQALNSQFNVHSDENRDQIALAAARELHELAERHLPQQHAWRARAAVVHGAALSFDEQFAAARPLLEEGIGAMEARPDTFTYKDRAAAYHNLSTALAKLREPEAAASAIDEAAKLYREGQQAESVSYADLRLEQAIWAYAAADYALAEACLEDVGRLRDKLLRDPLHLDRALEYDLRGRLKSSRNNYAGALEWQQKRLAILESHAPDDFQGLADAARAVASLLILTNAGEQAIATARKGRAFANQMGDAPEAIRRVFAADLLIGEGLILTGKLDEAEQLLRQTHAAQLGLRAELSAGSDEWLQATAATVDRDAAATQSAIAELFMRRASANDALAAKLLQDAEVLLAEAIATLEQLQAMSHIDTSPTLQRAKARMMALQSAANVTGR